MSAFILSLTGANSVTFYIYKEQPVSPLVKSVLEDYVKKGTAVLIPWDLPIPANHIWCVIF